MRLPSFQNIQLYSGLVSLLPLNSTGNMVCFAVAENATTGCVALGGKFSTSEAAVKSSGFTRYQKAESGVYERTAGSGGPEVLYRD
jgi:hypothetical protein